MEDALWSTVTSGTRRAGVSVFWELLANIHKLQLSVSVAADEPAQLLLADASTVRCAVVTGLPSGQLSAAGSSRGHLVGVAVHTLPLPCASTLPVGPLAWQQSSDGARQLLDARIDVEPSDDAAERALSAKYAAILDSELQACSALAALYCGWCGQRLAANDDDGAAAALVRKALAMPSDHWVELADLWVCHKETFTQFAKQPLQPSVEHALLSAVAVHLHASLLRDDAVVVDSASSLHCRRCLARLGQRTATALQLYKHAVSTRPRPGDADGNLFAGYSLPMLYAAQLYSACLARLVYFFSLTGDDGTPVLRVRVLSTALVSLSPHRHLKLLYQRPSLATAADPTSPFATPRSHESIRCHFDDAVQLLDALVHSNQQLPHSRRHVAGWSLGFLPLPYLFRS